MLTRSISMLTSRKFRSFAGLTLLATAFSSTVAAQNDLDLLLSDLSFGETPESPTLDSAAEAVADEVNRTPKFGPVIEAPPIVPEPEPMERPVVTQAEPMPSFPGQDDFNALDAAQPQAPLPESASDVPGPAAEAEGEVIQPPQPLRSPEQPSVPDAVQIQPPQPEPATVDFAEMFADPSCASDAVLGVPGDCAGASYCRPHRRPTLPPPSSLVQYFRSPACYSDVWAGYERDCHRHCQAHHKHLHGDCDCFKSKGAHGCGHCSELSGCEAHGAINCQCGN